MLLHGEALHRLDQIADRAWRSASRASISAKAASQRSSSEREGVCARWRTNSHRRRRAQPEPPMIEDKIGRVDQPLERSVASAKLRSGGAGFIELLLSRLEIVQMTFKLFKGGGSGRVEVRLPATDRALRRPSISASTGRRLASVEVSPRLENSCSPRSCAGSAHDLAAPRFRQARGEVDPIRRGDALISVRTCCFSSCCERGARSMPVIKVHSNKALALDVVRIADDRGLARRSDGSPGRSRSRPCRAGGRKC